MRPLSEGTLPSGPTETQRERARCRGAGWRDAVCPGAHRAGAAREGSQLFGFFPGPRVSFILERETEAQLRDVC